MIAKNKKGGNIMTEERRLANAGMPIEDAITLSNDMRRDGTLPEFVEKQEQKHTCQCGSVGICSGCCDCRKCGAME